MEYAKCTLYSGECITNKEVTSMGWCGPSYGYGPAVAGAGYPGYGSSFVLIVVLFILLIIVGCAWC